MRGRVSRSRVLRGLIVAVCAAGALPAAAQDPRASAPMTPAMADSIKASVAPPVDDVADAPVNADTYRVGSGDRLQVTIWGRVNTTRTLMVTPEGRVLVPGAGAIDVGGLSLRVARERLERAVRSHVRDSDVFVELLGVRRFKVFVTGMVQRPQAVRAAATLRVSEVIDRAGGFGERAARRGIRVEHADGSVELADVAGFTAAGFLARNPFVREGDVVVVPARGAVFLVDGAVGAPGTYDLMPGDTAELALQLAGGAFPGAELATCEFYRFDGQTVHGPLPLDLTSAAGRAQAIGDGDRLYVRRPTNYARTEVVNVSGEVNLAGPYALHTGETLASVLARAGGMTSFADSSTINIDRRELASPANDEVYGLQRLDPARLRDSDLELTRLVAAGRAGRFTVDLVREPGARNTVLRDGDRVEIARAAQQLRLAGEVRRPGLFPFTPGKAISDYVEMAGGYTRHADRGHVRVSKPRGWHTVEGQDGSPLEQGDVVWVFAKPRTQSWARLRDIVGIAAQLATVYLVIRNTNGTN